ncbi:MAG: tetratricopeptide repeat protein [Candidatus Sumerlaeota bacterium]|nr:tetratricopeptide repeat protein [Candidatus Sumerlaeota bacterium]
MTAARAWTKADRLAIQGDLPQAALFYERAARDLPDCRLPLRLARCHQARNDLQAARQACERALALAPDSLPARYFLALSQLDAGELDRAQEGFSEVISRQEENYAAICLRALARYMAGARQTAVAEWKAFFCANMDFLVRFVATLESERLADSSAKNAAGVAEPSAANASSPAEPAAAATPKSSRRRLMSECLRALKAKKSMDALQAARRLAGLYPKDSDCQFARGYAALEAECFSEAEKALALALRLDRRDMIRRQLWLRRKATRREVRELQAKIGFNPAAQALRAQALIRLGRCEEARAILQSIQQEGPESYHKFYYLGLCDLAEGRRFEAMRWFQYAFEHYMVDTLEMFTPALREWAERLNVK